MRAYRKTGQMIQMATDHPLKGKFKKIVQRITRAQLKSELIKQCDHLKRSEEEKDTAASTTTDRSDSSGRSNDIDKEIAGR